MNAAAKFFATGWPQDLAGCHCYADGNWIVPFDQIPAVCDHYEEDSGGGCSNCQHPQECHK